MQHTFTKKVDGKERTRVANTPAEAVQLRFNGWKEVPTTPAKASPASEKAKPDNDK